MKKLIIGNFKMNTKPSEFKQYAMTLATKTKTTKNDAVVCPPFTHLGIAKEFLNGSKVEYGAQNISDYENGPYTGEISASMIKDLGSTYVIIGHSDRRNKFKESERLVNRKIKTALANGLKVVLCVGESLHTREQKQTYNFVKKQLDDELKGIYENELDSVVIAYEPIWAIGTGKVATKKDIEKMAEIVRKEIEFNYSAKAAKNITVVYGGSVNLQNYKKIMNIDGIDGVLIGGACLDCDGFAQIINEQY